VEPGCRGGRWSDGTTGPVPGARFRGRNRWGLFAWSRTCVVEQAEPGRRFVFSTVPDRFAPDSTRWAYTFEEAPGGTKITESYEIVLAMPVRIQASVIRAFLPHHFDMRPHMAATLAAVEAGAGLLPGQAAAPPGPIDVTGMWVMHQAARVAATAEALHAHLGHEERDAMALVQRYLTAADWERLENEVLRVRRGLPPAGERGQHVVLGGVERRLRHEPRPAPAVGNSVFRPDRRSGGRR
jgi:hypothetical protein